VAGRADRVIARVRDIGRDVLLFSSGTFLRVLGARWLGLEACTGRLPFLGTATVSVLGYEHGVNEPVLRLWNDDQHVAD
jgi:broad specificity phosphatase PhoE